MVFGFGEVFWLLGFGGEWAFGLILGFCKIEVFWLLGFGGAWILGV